MADELNPSLTSDDYDKQAPFWCMVDAIIGGSPEIKKGGIKYLPKFANEKQSVYDYRLENAPFTNIYSDISKNLAAKPFAKELAMKDGTPGQYTKLAENIDGQGNNQHVVAASLFKDALDHAITWLMVDYTKAKPRADGKPLSKAEEAEQKLRPYWVHIPAMRMKAVYSDFVGGSEVIYHARFEENATELDGFTEVCVERIREFNRVRMVDEIGRTTGYGAATWRLWQKTVGTDKKETWSVIESGDITIGEIPIIPVVLTERVGGSWIITPALRDLAYMQISEYRQEANLEWIKVMTCHPMTCISGMVLPVGEDGKEIEVTVGPNTVFIIPQNNAGTGPAGDVKIVEPSASSITENRAQLELTRKEMRDLGMQPLAEANLTVVTTANVSKKASSAVQAWAFRFKDVLERAWKLTALWLGDNAEPEVVIHTDFAIETESGTELDALLKSEGQGIYSKQTVREEFKRRNVVSNDVTDDQEQERIASEQQGLDVNGVNEPQIDPVTGQPIDPNQPPPQQRAA